VLIVCFSFLYYTNLCLSCDKNLEEFLMLCFVLWASCYNFLSIKFYVCIWVDLLFVHITFISNIRKETRFFTYFLWTRRVRRRMLLYKMTHGVNIGSLRMIDLRRCYSTTQTLCDFPTKHFLYGMGTVTSKAWMPNTLVDCTIMIHPDTYLLIQFYLTHLMGLWSCSQPWLTWTNKYSTFLDFFLICCSFAYL
jgi:hypothetical protein